MIKKIKIHILYKFREDPWGGGNQFLKALKREIIKRGLYAGDLKIADIILFNSHHKVDDAFKLKKKFPNKIFIHRIDGPIYMVRGKDKDLDKVIFKSNKLIADGLIFQSNWCKKKNRDLFNISASYETVIHNAPENKIFNRHGKVKLNPDRRIKLIATSWSSNWKKGFEIYKYLDENLDFSKYEMTFVGRSPIKFKNIQWIEPVVPSELAEILKKHDIYITASQNDPCSNSLIEALSCGLTAVALNDGGHPELVQKGGELFNGREDVVKKIEKVVTNYQQYQSRIPEFSIKKVAQDYYKFAEKIHEDIRDKRYTPKKYDFSTKINFYKLKVIILKYKLLNKLRAIKNKIC